MRTTHLGLLIVLLVVSSLAESAVISKKKLRLQIAGKEHHLELYAETGVAFVRRPGLVLVPEYWGKDELAVQPAEALAGKGYIVLVLDPFGGGRNASESAMADKLVAEAEAKGIDHVVDLVDRAVELLKTQEGVDQEQIGAIGFGYGGGLVYNLAKSGKSGLKAVVSFYGGTKKIRETSRVGRLPELLYVRPTNDVYTSDEEFSSFKIELANSGFNYEVFTAAAGYYGFIHKGIESYTNAESKTFMFYDAQLATKAWQRTFRFLQEKMNTKSLIRAPTN
jgi:dienelactone hydrolase